ncbi:hypothetical protein [Phaeobacter piscinae]|uniref:hypothetical protein n=1 Tax=Phaeobacter piscinae TaxID=1580596 RepID=UPI000C9C2A0C|nr:hypothetical protein [Phaeobacter piscinae]AUQ74782.1 hypothetical protein PhaeoP71_01921 [Phaeobacter piscinae]
MTEIGTETEAGSISELVARVEALEMETAYLKSAIVMLATADLNAAAVSTERTLSSDGQSKSYAEMLKVHERMFNFLSIKPQDNSDE